MKKIASKILVFFLFIWLLFSLFPIFWAFFTSVKPPGEATELPPDIFFTPNFTNYKSILFGTENVFYNLSQQGFWNFFGNSFLVATLTTILTLLLGTTAAFYIARFMKKTKNLLLWILSFRMLPPIAIVIPFYLMIGYLNIVDSVVSLILIYTVFNLPLTIWLNTTYLKSIPDVYDEMGLVDGFTIWKIFYKITLPLMKPSIIASALLTFIFSWNEFLFASILTGIKAKTLPVLATGFITQRGIIWGQLTATSILITIPVFLLVLYFQNYFVNGLSFGLKRIKN